MISAILLLKRQISNACIRSLSISAYPKVHFFFFFFLVAKLMLWRWRVGFEICELHALENLNLCQQSFSKLYPAETVNWYQWNNGKTELDCFRFWSFKEQAESEVDMQRSTLWQPWWYPSVRRLAIDRRTCLWYFVQHDVHYEYRETTGFYFKAARKASLSPSSMTRVIGRYGGRLYLVK